MKFHYEIVILQEIYCKIKYQNNNLFLKKKQNSTQKFFLSFYLQPTFSHRRAITQFLPHFPFLFASLFIIEKHLSHRAISFFSPSSPITDSFEQYFRDGARQPIVLRAGQSSSSLRAGYTGGNTRTSVGVYIIHI